MLTLTLEPWLGGLGRLLIGSRGNRGQGEEGQGVEGDGGSGDSRQQGAGGVRASVSSGV